MVNILCYFPEFIELKHVRVSCCMTCTCSVINMYDTYFRFLKITLNPTKKQTIIKPPVAIMANTMNIGSSIASSLMIGLPSNGTLSVNDKMLN